MSEKNRKYSLEFIESTLKLVDSSEVSTSQIAKELGVKVSTVYTWIKKYRTDTGNKMQLEPRIYEENKYLKKELARITQERDLLKKATAYFAKDFH